MSEHEATAGTGTKSARPMSAWAASRPARWLYLTHRLLQKLSGDRVGLHVYLFCAQPTHSPALAKIRDDPRTQIVPVAPTDPIVQDFPRPRDVLERRFASGATCHAVVVKEQFAGHIWLAHGHYDEDVVRCRYMLPGPSTVWDYDVYVVPAFRATRAMARLWKGVGQVLRSQSVMWSYSRISLFNPASVQTHEQLGARHLCTGAFLALGGVQVALFTRPCRLQLTSSRTSATPTLQLPAAESAPSDEAGEGT